MIVFSLLFWTVFGPFFVLFLGLFLGPILRPFILNDHPIGPKPGKIVLGFCSFGTVLVLGPSFVLNDKIEDFATMIVPLVQSGKIQ